MLYRLPMGFKDMYLHPLPALVQGYGVGVGVGGTSL